ncbi:transposase [Ktedonobacter sp. SOSP1-52]|nr:transposase [Ktedonobacter sp. SOSP1-52]GHO63679.1 transposase [Ktedonobacter sp. SOSP1-52]
MYPVALRDEIRTWVLIQGKSQRAASRHFGLSRNTVARLLAEEPATNERQYQRQAPTKTPVRDAALPHIQKWLQENEWLERWAPKQCWTAHRMWTELRTLGIPIGESTVRLFVQELRTSSKPVYVPLDFAPGERAEFDFGEATIKLKGQVAKVPFLVGRLRFSGAMFVECFPTQRQEAFLLGQRHAFEFWGGVPRIAVYDNLKPAVLQVLQGHSRREHDVFLHFQSVYRFEALFANVHAGWEKGSVENLVGYARRNYLVPLPEGTDLEAINVHLGACCLSDQQRTMARQTDSIAARLAFERRTLGPLPTHAPELALVVEVLAHSTGRVRFQTNDYSVPIQYAYQRLTLKADPFRVRLYAGGELVADHPRCYEKRQVIEDWRHYVPLLLKKSFAVPWASALRHGELPPAFEAARLDLVAHRADGNREFARLLDLCLTHSVETVETALTQARTQGGWSADTVRQLLNVASVQQPPVPPLDPRAYPAYQRVTPLPDLCAYNRLLEVQP